MNQIYNRCPIRKIMIRRREIGKTLNGGRGVGIIHWLGVPVIGMCSHMYMMSRPAQVRGYGI